ncbi:MAG TPA: hypothetical protein VLA74_06520 [Nitrososphaeraceae archaeon]|nr:hypothetical protein [Nitrososphaeraceae archaeon]
MIHKIIGIVISTIFFVILLEYVLISELYGEDLAMDEKVNITILKDNNNIQIIPAKIGIKPNLWKDHSLDDYSYDPKKIAPLNTKRYDGVIHIESIYDREFTLENFLDIWGFDKSKIIDVFVDNKNKEDYKELSLDDGQKLKIVIKKEDISYQNFTKYNDSKISFEYPSEWKLLNSSSESQTKYHYSYGSLLSPNEKFRNLIELFPQEFQYMTTPLLTIRITELYSNITLDDYYNENIHKLLQANETNFPKLINKPDYTINGNPALMINLNTTLVAQPGLNNIGNSINQTSFHIWTIKKGYFYDISFEAFESAYEEYYPIINKIIESIQIN